MKVMLGFHVKRQLLDLIQDATQLPGVLSGVRVLYSPDKSMPREAVYGVGGISAVELADESGTMDIDRPRVSIVIRVADAAPELGAWTTDERAEELFEAIGTLIAENRHFAGRDSVASVVSYQWSNPSTIDETVTILIMEVGIEGVV